MIKHSDSLLISILFHIFLFLLFLTLYKLVTVENTKLKEEHICINLKCFTQEAKITAKPNIPTPKVVEKKKPIKKKIEKKIIKQKKVLTKKVKKQTLAKKTIKIEKAKKLKRVEKLEKESNKPIKPFIQKIETHNKIQTHSEPTPQNTPKKVVKKKASQEEIYIKENLTQIMELLKENLYYPRRARKRGIEGDVVIKFHLSKTATVSNIEVISSKKEILSRAAIKTIENLSSQFPKPKKEIVLKIPISYRLK